jgi:hypothetical protein
MIMRGVTIFMIGILVGFALGAPVALLALRRAQGEASRPTPALVNPKSP